MSASSSKLKSGASPKQESQKSKSVSPVKEKKYTLQHYDREKVTVNREGISEERVLSSIRGMHSLGAMFGKDKKKIVDKYLEAFFKKSQVGDTTKIQVVYQFKNEKILGPVAVKAVIAVGEDVIAEYKNNTAEVIKGMRRYIVAAPDYHSILTRTA